MIGDAMREDATKVGVLWPKLDHDICLASDEPMAFFITLLPLSSILLKILLKICLRSRSDRVGIW